MLHPHDKPMPCAAAWIGPRPWHLGSPSPLHASDFNFENKSFNFQISDIYFFFHILSFQNVENFEN